MNDRQCFVGHFVPTIEIELFCAALDELLLSDSFCNTCMVFSLMSSTLFGSKYTAASP